VTVHGTATCSQPAQLSVTATIPQFADALLSGTATCTPGRATLWTATGWVAPVGPGSATLTATVDGFDPFYQVDGSASTTAQVRFDAPAPPAKFVSRRPV
jgi:hypothetical protein